MFKRCAILISLLLTLPTIISAQEWLPQPQNEVEARNVETLRLWSEEVWGNGRMDLVPELVAPEYVRHEANETRVVTPESYVKEIEAGRASGWQFNNHAVSIDGDLVWTRWSFSGDGPDGKVVTGKGIQIYRLENGKLAETWNLIDVPSEPWVN